MRWIALAALTFAGLNVFAKPCGVFNRAGETLSRDGDQAMYVYFRNGWQNMVVNPAFKGNAKDFALCMALPSIPEFRMEKAEFFKELREFTSQNAVPSPGSGTKRGGGEQNAPQPEVVVVKTEVSGAYKAVTLKATAVKALTDWLDENQYRYNEAAAAVFEEYVKKNWFFVAVKVIREDTAKEFDGRLRPMGLRFPTSEPVIWTRFTTLNPGGLTINLYVVTDSPMFIGEIPTTFQNSWPNSRWNGKGSADYPVTRIFTSELRREALARYSHMTRVLDEDVWSDLGTEKRLEKVKQAEADPARFAEQTRPRYERLWLTRFMGHAPAESLANELNFVPEKATTKEAAARLITVLKRNSSDRTGKRKAIDALRASTVQVDPSSLITELKTEDAPILGAVAETIGALNLKSAVPALIDAMEKTDDFFARAAIRDALVSITGQRFKLTESGQYREWWERNK